MENFDECLKNLRQRIKDDLTEVLEYVDFELDGAEKQISIGLALFVYIPHLLDKLTTHINSQRPVLAELEREKLKGLNS